MEAYLQESGRGGRDRCQAYAVLRLGPDEVGGAVGSRAVQPSGAAAAPARSAGQARTVQPVHLAKACRTAGRNARTSPTAVSAGGAGYDGPAGPPREAGYERGTLELRRYGEFVRAVADPIRCRREALLGLLGARPEACFGCDVCAGTVQAEPEGAVPILRLVKRYPRFFTLRGAVTVLSGRYKPEIYERNLWRFKGFGALAYWDEECIEEAVLTMIRSGRLRHFTWGLWKGMLQTLR